MTTDETLNELLVRLFKDIMEIEGKCLVTEEFKNLSYNDFHVIEAIIASAQVFSIHGDFKHFCILRVYYYLTLK